MAATMLLDVVAWDLCLDAHGNWAMASEPYAIIQSVASACRLFLGELYYDNSRGVPYYQNIFGGSYPIELIKADMITAALTVPGVTGASVYLNPIVNRKITGQIQVQTSYGTLTANI